MKALRRLGDRLSDPKVGLPAVLAFSAFFFLLFCAVDARPPNDHDDFYTANSIWAVQDLGEAGLLAKPGVLWDHFRGGRLHPRLAQTTLVASLGTFGHSRFVFRATNLPFLLLFALGTYLMAKELAGPRLALLAAFVASNVPMVINYSRKWDIQFHAAALTPIGIWLAIAALRADGRRALKLWVGFGVWQGLRLYTHPIVMPDVAVTIGVVGLILWPHGRALGRSFLPRLGGFILGLVAWFGVALYYLGIARSWLGEPEYSLRRYITQRGSYSDVGWWIESDWVAKANHFYELITEVIWLHTMPAFTALLLPGLLLLPIALLRKSWWADREPGTRWLVVALLVPVLAQLPTIALATSNRAFLNDWLLLVPPLVVLALVTSSAAATTLDELRAPWSTGWAVAILVAGCLHHLIPLGGRVLGPDPLEDPEHYDNLLLGPFTRSSSGRHYTTHHVPTRHRSAGTVLAETVASLGGDLDEPASFALLDLTWDPAVEGQRGCRLGPPDSVSTWAWSPPIALNVAAREVSPWPFVFEGSRASDRTAPTTKSTQTHLRGRCSARGARSTSRRPRSSVASSRCRSWVERKKHRQGRRTPSS